MITKIKKLTCDWKNQKTYMSHDKFDLESILHQTTPMANIWGQNLMGVLQMD
jgi:hypothetical protein